MKWLLFCSIILLVASCKKSPTESHSALLTLDINAATNIGLYDADLSAMATGDKNVASVEIGFVIDTFSPPTIGKNFRKISVSLDPSGTFTASLKHLLPSLRYYVRAYAKTGDAVTYSKLIFFDTFGEKIFYGDMLLSNQQELETFAANHYNRIAGDLNIIGDVYDLAPLIDLGTIDGRLRIASTTQLTSLDGMQNFWRPNNTGGGFAIDIRDNQGLQNLQGLEGVVTTTGEINIYRNPALVSLRGLDSLTYVKYGRLYIDQCVKLTDLHGLEGLRNVENEINVLFNENLVNVSALRNLEHTTSLSIRENWALSDLCPLKNVLLANKDMAFVCNSNASNPSRQEIITNCPQ